MNSFNEELAVRYVDGDLTADELEAFQRLLARSPEVRALVEDHQRLRGTIAQAFGPAPDDRDLTEIAARVAGANVLALRPLHVARRARFTIFPVGPFATGTAIAASLLVGVFGGWMLHQPTRTAMFEGKKHQIVAAGNLETALTGRLASETVGSPVRIGLSFASSHGICRTFSLNSGTDGLACRDRGRWIVHALADRPQTGSSTEFRLAASDTAPEVLSAVDRMIEGRPFDTVSEERARAAGWAR